MPRPSHRAFALALALVCAAFALSSCGSDIVRTNDPLVVTPAADASVPLTALQVSLWRPAVRRVRIEVSYAVGAAPYVSAVPGVGDAWSIFAANAARLFLGMGKTVTVPHTLAEMTPIVSAATEYTADELLALSRRTRVNLPSTAEATFHVLFVNGYFRDASGARRTNLLGGHLDNTSVIVVFKPVVASTLRTAAPYVGAVVEQATLVHEFGHAVGLVDNGIAMVRPHLDTAHPHHCTSSLCVMNAWNEGADGATDFVARYMATGDAVLFDQDCLDDAAQAFATAR